jgi:hypothetical protein
LMGSSTPPISTLAGRAPVVWYYSRNEVRFLSVFFNGDVKKR